MRVMMASASWIAEQRLTEEEVLGRNVYDILTWLPDEWKSMHRQVLRGETMSHDRDPYPGKNGGQRWLKWSSAPWRDGNGEIGRHHPVHEDVTDIVRAQHEVESSKERMSYGMSDHPDDDLGTGFRESRNQCRGRLGRSVPQKPTFDTDRRGPSIHPADREILANRWRAHMAGGAPYTAEYRVVFPDGKEVRHAAAVRILKSVKGSPARAFAVIQVITARKQIELQAMEAEQRALVAAAARIRFPLNMSHEIRTR